MTSTRIFFLGGPKDGQSELRQGELPPLITHSESVQEGPGFQRGHIYQKVLDNFGVDLGDGPQAEYRYLGDTAHGQPGH